jgi:hypothetical protein
MGKISRKKILAHQLSLEKRLVELFKKRTVARNKKDVRGVSTLNSMIREMKEKKKLLRD